ncbi:RNA-binding protein [Candidatus Daviesbacteria bacterium]|nr:RNA-binding protein [Candidatus Daviesbacteria bacterium]
MTKLFVGGLTYAKTSQDLQTMFEAFGAVQSAQVIMDKFTNQSKGFGFVEMANDEEAQAAIKALDGTEQDGRRLGVSVARPREDRPRNSGFGGDRNRY